ncbi:MAG: DEAD/DEAH box helicase [Peptococcaceae bacterium]|nr:DEAD/DEAH box helicase [Peptococcaceae bacterium]
MTTFSDFGLTDKVLKSINNMGFEEATPIQEKAIPIQLQGLDLIGQAHTGTGKTAAFGIPMVEFADKITSGIQGMVLTPTRELAIQVAEEINRIGQIKRVQALPIYGGQDISRQIRALKNRPQIIVGTPGRLLDHLRRKTVRLGKIKMVVIDEADEMLNMGFIDDIKTILAEVPEERQTLLFSATMPAPIQDLAKKFMKTPQIIRTEGRQATVPNTEQNYIVIEEEKKFEIFCRLLDIQAPERAIVFGRTKRRVDELFEALNKRGFTAEALHGDLTQSKRDYVMRRFREGTIDLLVATDVAARGLDISGVTHIYNFDIPQDPEGYVHRIGRTGRAGNAGKAITLVTPREIHHLKTIERSIGGRIYRKPVPTIKEAEDLQQRVAVDKLLQAVDSPELASYHEAAEGLLKDMDALILVSAAIKALTKEIPDQTQVVLTEDRPLRVRQYRSKNYSGHSGHKDSRGHQRGGGKKQARFKH